jgi:hypothetical protein
MPDISIHLLKKMPGKVIGHHITSVKTGFDADDFGLIYRTYYAAPSALIAVRDGQSKMLSSNGYYPTSEVIAAYLQEFLSSTKVLP